MTALDGYLRRLEAELGRRGLAAARILAETREHLVDDISHALRRGLTVDEAERETIERFGSPEAIASQFQSGRFGIIGRWRSRLSRLRQQWQSSSGDDMATHPAEWFGEAARRVWQRRWWIVVPTVITIAITSAASYYLLPLRYRSESVIIVVPGRVPAELVRSTVTSSLDDRLQMISDMVLSRPRLERIISDFHLYERERGTATTDDIIHQMRQSIWINVLASHAADNNGGGLRIGFTSSNPRSAQQVAERLSNLFIEENFRDRQTQAKGTLAFIETEIAEVRQQIVDYEKTLDALRAANRGRELSKADVVPYEVLQDTYRALLIKRQQSQAALHLERRQIGEQFKIVDPPRVPDRPMGVSRMAVNTIGGFAGLGLAMAFALARPKQNR